MKPSTYDVSHTTSSRTCDASVTDIGLFVIVTRDFGSQRNRPRAKAVFPAESSTVNTTEYMPGSDTLYDGKSLLVRVINVNKYTRTNTYTTQNVLNCFGGKYTSLLSYVTNTNNIIM